MDTDTASDRILIASTIQTLGPAGRTEAVRVVDGRITAVGSRDDVLATRTRRTDIVDLGTATVLPGLFEPHTHPDLCAQLYSWVDVSGFSFPNVSGVEHALAEAVAATPTGEWIFAFGLDPMLTPDLGIWDRDRLDALTRHHPVFVMIQSLHTAFVNSAALERAGVTEAIAEPGGGGHYVRDTAGRLTGRLEEQPAMLPFARFFMLAGAELHASIAAQYRRLRDVGITSIGVAGTFIDPSDLAIVAADPSTPIRTTAYLHHGMSVRLNGAPRDGDRYRVRGVKLWYDGSPYTGTMLLDEPYLESELCCCTLGIPAGSTGRANFTPDEMHDTLAELFDDGWQVMTHAQGDRGCSEILDLYASVIGARSEVDHRWRLEHCALVSRADLGRAKTIGVSPSFHVNHLLHYGPELRDHIIGPERAERLMPIAEAVELGHRVSLHADSPMYPPNPMSLVRTAVTRKTRNGDRLAGHHAIDVDTAMRAVTIDAAWQLHDDHETGSIEIGKRADFTILERDPYDVNIDDLDKIDVLGTWLDGAPTA